MDFICIASLDVFVEFLQIPDFMFLRRVSKEFILRWNIYSKFMWNRLKLNLNAQLKFNGFCQSSIESFNVILQGGNISFSGGGLKAALTGKVRKGDADLYVYPEGAAFSLKTMSPFMVCSLAKVPNYGVLKSWTDNGISCVINLYHRGSFDVSEKFSSISGILRIYEEEVDDNVVSILKNSQCFDFMEVIYPGSYVPKVPAVQLIVMSDEGSGTAPKCWPRFDRSDVMNQIWYESSKWCLEIAHLDHLRCNMCAASDLVVGLARIYSANASFEEMCEMLSLLQHETRLRLPPNFIKLFGERNSVPNKRWQSRFKVKRKQVNNLFQKLLFVRVKKAYVEGLSFTNLNVYEKVLENGEIVLVIEPKKN